MQINSCVMLIVVSVYSITAYGEVNNQKGKATVSYSEKTATPAVKANAMFLAEMKAIDAYYASLGDSATEAQDKIIEQIKADIDRYMLNVETLDEQDVPASHQYTIVVRATLNTSRLRTLLKQKNAEEVANAGASHSPLGFLFLSRAIDSRTVYDERVMKRVDTSINVESKGAVRPQVTLSGTSHIAAEMSADTSVSTEAGGSTTQKSTSVSYKIFPSTNLNQSVSKEFTEAGFQINEAALIEPYTNGKLKVSDIEKDFSSGNDLRSETLNNVVQGLRNANFKYFALATLDVSQVTKDPATGMPQISVTVNAKILDVSPGIPRSVAVAGPIQFTGTGPTEEEARTGALALAARATARDLTSQLTNAGIH